MVWLKQQETWSLEWKKCIKKKKKRQSYSREQWYASLLLKALLHWKQWVAWPEPTAVKRWPLTTFLSFSLPSFSFSFLSLSFSCTSGMIIVETQTIEAEEGHRVQSLLERLYQAFRFYILSVKNNIRGIDKMSNHVAIHLCQIPIWILQSNIITLM